MFIICVKNYNSRDLYMKLFAGITLALLVVFSISFMIFDSLGYMGDDFFKTLFASVSGMAGGKIAIALVVIVLLTSDLFLPVPSSIVMTLSGYYLGLTTGMLAALTGAMGSALLGFYLSRKFGHGAFTRITGGKDTERIEKFFNNYGIWAILLSRSVPMLTEIISCLAGLSEMTFRRFFIFSLAGSMPVCLVYAWAGTLPNNAGNLEVPIIVAFLLPGIGFGVMKLVSFYSKRNNAADFLED